jgi:hypothetical protein
MSKDKPTTYLKVILGKNKINTKDEKVKKSVDPGYYRKCEIKTVMPGASVCHIQVW